MCDIMMDMIHVSLVLLIISLISQLSLFIAAPVASLHLGAPPGAGLHLLRGSGPVLWWGGDLREDKRHHSPLRLRVL